MREKRAGVVVFEEIDLTQEQFDQPIFWLLAAMLAFMPAALGSWDPWAEALALAGACGLAVLLAVKLARRTDVPFVWSWTYLPVGLFFLLVFIELFPLPAAWVGAISPKTLATNQYLLADAPGAAEKLTHLHFTFYPEGTWHHLRNLVAVTCVFVVVINVFRRSEQMIRLLWAIAWVGAAEGALAILQILTHASGVYWLLPLWGEARPEAGTFPNHNCFSQFMNLSAGPMLGLLLLKIDSTFHRHDYDSAEVMHKLASPEFRSAYLLAGMLIVSVSSVFLSLSRSGMLSIAVAGLAVGVLLAVRGGSRGMGIGGWVAGVMLVIVFSLVMMGGANLVEGRIAKIGNPEDRFDRFQLTKDALRSWEDYPVVGMGLGSFRYTFQHYDRSNISAVASDAEDDYAQLLQETGVAGAVIAGIFLAMIAGCFQRARARGKKSQGKKSQGEKPQGEKPRGEGSQDEKLEHDEDELTDRPVQRSIGQPMGVEGETPSQSDAADRGVSHGTRRSGGTHRRRRQAASPASSLSLGLCFGLVAILVQSTADFGQHCISIASLTAISCALMVNLASLRRRERGLEREVHVVRGFRSVRIAAVAVTVVLATLLLWQANDVREAFADFTREDELATQLSKANWSGDVGDVTDMNRAADAAAALRPGDVRFRFWRAMNRFFATTAGSPIDPVSEDYMLDQKQRAIVQQMADDLQQARWICPTYGELYAQLGQWERSFLGKRAEGARHIRIAFDLNPGEPTVCSVMATLDGEEGLWSDSVKHFRRAAMLFAPNAQDAINLYVDYFHRPDVALEFADGDIDRLHMLSAKLRSIGKDPALGPTTGPATRTADEDIALAADKRADSLIRAAADRSDASADTLAQMGLLCARTKDFPGAVKYLGRALLRDYAEVDWRMECARSYAAMGRKDDAISQAQTVLLISPRLQAAQELIDKLTSPATQPIEDHFH